MSRRIICNSPRLYTLMSASRAKGNNTLLSKTDKTLLFSRSRQFSSSSNGIKSKFYNESISKVNDGSKLRVFNPLISYSTSNTNESPQNKEVPYIDAKDNDTLAVMCKDMTVIEDFVTEEEEQNIFNEIEPYLKRLKYQSSHWDDAIHEYRETERRKWTEKNTAIIQRVRDVAFPPGVPQISFVHVLDLKETGQIKPHVDAVKFCGNTIAGISLLSSAVMRLVHTENKAKAADILLKRRSLYIMKDEARYKYTHEVLPEADSYFKGTHIPRDRRISVICRNEPET